MRHTPSRRRAEVVDAMDRASAAVAADGVQPPPSAPPVQRARAPARPAGRGLVVALLGPDGAGKSTIAASLRANSGLPIRTLYLGLYGGRLGRRWPLPGMGFLVRLAAVLMSRGQCWYHRRRGRVVVLDRHALDERASGDIRGGRAALRARTLLALAPRPDVVVVLDAPAEVLLTRKPAEAHDAARARQRYRHLARVLGAQLVDTSRSVDEAAVIVMGVIERAMGTGGSTAADDG